ncbi:hypothetical protein L9F63_024544, partial [Diploptera punctata]
IGSAKLPLRKQTDHPTSCSMTPCISLAFQTRKNCEAPFVATLPSVNNCAYSLNG